MYAFAAIATVVTVAEILKNNGLALEKSKYPLPSFFGIYYWGYLLEIMTSLELMNIILNAHKNFLIFYRDNDFYC